MREIPVAQVLAHAATANPWWASAGGVQETFAQWLPRPYLELLYPLIETSNVRRAVVVMGPRRVGKTVMLHHAIQRLMAGGVSGRQIAYFALDQPLYNGLGLEQLLGLMKRATGVDPAADPVHVFFDEIQYLRGWEGHLKALVDAYPLVKATCSGSAAAALRLKSNESGAGRFTDFMLPPLTFYEYLTLLAGAGQRVPHLGRHESGDFRCQDLAMLNEFFVRYLNFGGYPEMALSAKVQSDPRRFIKADIVDKVLLRDLPSLYGIDDIQELNALFTTLAFNSAEEVSLQALSQGSGVTKPTIRRYIEYLEAAFLIRQVERVDHDARRFKRVNTFKTYLTNPSIRCALFSSVDAESDDMGSLVETAIFSQWFHAGISDWLRYARWKGGEVDIVLIRPGFGARWAVECKWTDRFANRPRELKGLISFCKRNEIPQARVTTRTATRDHEQDGVLLEFRPAAEYCYTLGRNIIEGNMPSDTDIVR